LCPPSTTTTKNNHNNNNHHHHPKDSSDDRSDYNYEKAIQKIIVDFGVYNIVKTALQKWDWEHEYIHLALWPTLKPFVFSAVNYHNNNNQDDEEEEAAGSNSSILLQCQKCAIFIARAFRWIELETAAAATAAAAATTTIPFSPLKMTGMMEDTLVHKLHASFTILERNLCVWEGAATEKNTTTNNTTLLLLEGVQTLNPPPKTDAHQQPPLLQNNKMGIGLVTGSIRTYAQQLRRQGLCWRTASMEKAVITPSSLHPTAPPPFSRQEVVPPSCQQQQQQQEQNNKKVGLKHKTKKRNATVMETENDHCSRSSIDNHNRNNDHAAGRASIKRPKRTVTTTTTTTKINSVAEVVVAPTLQLLQRQIHKENKVPDPTRTTRPGTTTTTTSKSVLRTTMTGATSVGETPSSRTYYASAMFRSHNRRQTPRSTTTTTAAQCQNQVSLDPHNLSVQSKTIAKKKKKTQPPALPPPAVILKKRRRTSGQQGGDGGGDGGRHYPGRSSGATARKRQRGSGGGNGASTSTSDTKRSCCTTTTKTINGTDVQVRPTKMVVPREESPPPPPPPPQGFVSRVLALLWKTTRKT
jgi:hypothetical protein